MRKLLHEAEEIDRYIFNKMDTANRLVFEARMLVIPDLEEKVRHQRKAHGFIRWFARKQQLTRLESMYMQLMQDEHFKLELTSIFT